MQKRSNHYLLIYYFMKARILSLPVLSDFFLKSLQLARGHSPRTRLALHICQLMTRLTSITQPLPAASSKQSTKAWERKKNGGCSGNFGQEGLRNHDQTKHRSSDVSFPITHLSRRVVERKIKQSLPAPKSHKHTSSLPPPLPRFSTRPLGSTLK